MWPVANGLDNAALLHKSSWLQRIKAIVNKIGWSIGCSFRPSLIVQGVSFFEYILTTFKESFLEAAGAVVIIKPP